ncbi:MAG: Hpt domain-containing protein [Lysobacterales bacterium]
MTDSQRNLKPATEAHIVRLKRQFVDSFAERLINIEQWTDQCLAEPPDRQAMQQLRTEVHQLRGSSGLYELTELFREFDALQAELDEVLAEPAPARLSALTRRRLDRAVKMMRYPNRFL